MNKSELSEVVAADTGATQKEAAKAVAAVLAAIQKTVASGDKVSIMGFGMFEMVHKPARTARNPSTGGSVTVKESWVPKFRPGTDFKALVNAGGEKAAKVGA